MVPRIGISHGYNVEQFKTADDTELLDSNVENLVKHGELRPPQQADKLPTNYQDALAGVIAQLAVTTVVESLRLLSRARTQDVASRKSP